MFRKQPLLSAVFTTILGGESVESIFARQLADENGWHYIGLEEGYYKFHDVIQDKPISMSEEDVLKEALNRK